MRAVQGRSEEAAALADQRARIIHDETEKMIYSRTRASKFFGVPIAYLPYLLGARSDGQAQDRLPDAAASYTSVYGSRRDVPYFFALAPDYDITLTPTHHHASRARCCRANGASA